MIREMPFGTVSGTLKSNVPCDTGLASGRSRLGETGPSLSRGSRISRSVMAADFINVGGSGHTGWHKWSPGHGLGITIFALTTVFGLSALLIAMPELTTALTLRRCFTASLFRIPANHCPSTGLARAIDHTRRIHRRFFYRYCKSEGFGFFLSCIWAFRRTNTFCKTQLSMALAGGIDALYTCASPSRDGVETGTRRKPHSTHQSTYWVLSYSLRTLSFHPRDFKFNQNGR